jgi:myo-inositol-1(or 4)-monophosphatase
VQLRPETEAALAAVDVALELSGRRVDADQVTSKGKRDIVTGTDLAVEDAVRTTLLARYPDWTVVGEERGGEDAVGDRPYWLIDPICGTGNFASSLPLFSINLALVEDGRVTVAAVGDGGARDRFVAERGAGAFRVTPDGLTSLRVSDESLIVCASTARPRPSDGHHHGAEFVRAALVADQWNVRIIGSNVVFPYLATGRMAGYAFFNRVGPMHTAAGCLLAEEAGARVTDFQGRPWTVETHQFVVAATPGLHQEILDLVGATATPD